MIQLWDIHPEVFLVEKFYASARSHLYKEQMIDAIIDLQTSFEILIRNTHKLLLIQNGATQDELDRASSISFRNVIEDHIGRVLGVNLDEGYEAHDAYVNARNYLGDLLKQSGYLNANGNIDLNIFPKNTKGVLDADELLSRLKERGLISEDLKTYKPNNKK